VPVRVGADVGGRGIFLTHAPADQARVRHRHMIENYLGLLRMIGLEPGPAELVLPVDHTAQVATDEILAANGVKASDLVIGLAPGATYGPAKRWPKECFAELADRLMTECRAKVMLLLGPQERELGGEIRSLTRQAPLLWERNFPLLEVAALIKRCRVFIANDSGLMHMAAAVGTPVIALFGSTSPVWTSPGGPGHLVLRKPIACSPCFQRRCALNTYECLTSITVLEVLAAVETQLRNRTEADEVAPTAMPR
jgi:heptosyltransferase-2